MPVYTWSQTSASNATADPSINFAEGQAPSSLNDSNRAMMTALKKWGDDITGAIVTTGSSTAYAVTSNSVFDTLAHLNGQMIAFTPHTTNGATVTLNVDGLGAKPLRAFVGVELQSNSLISGTPYVAIYNSSDAAFYLHGNAGGTYGIPLSGFLAYAGSTAPSSAFVFPYGQALNRITYAPLFSLVGSTYGAGDGSTTFNIPDLRGRGIFFGDSMGGSAANRLTTANSGIDAANVSASGGSPNVTVAQNQLPNVGPTFVGSAGSVSVNSQGGVVSGTIFGNQVNMTTGGASFFAMLTQLSASSSSVNSTGSFTPAGGITSINGGVTQQSLITMPPAYILNCIMRVI